jgi:hypothetical protein
MQGAEGGGILAERTGEPVGLDRGATRVIMVHEGFETAAYPCAFYRRFNQLILLVELFHVEVLDDQQAEAIQLHVRSPLPRQGLFDEVMHSDLLPINGDVPTSSLQHVELAIELGVKKNEAGKGTSIFWALVWKPPCLLATHDIFVIATCFPF